MATTNRYYIAFPRESGEWDIVEEFEAEDDAEANRWAEQREDQLERQYRNTDWYVLDDSNRNINA